MFQMHLPIPRVAKRRQPSGALRRRTRGAVVRVAVYVPAALTAGTLRAAVRRPRATGGARRGAPSRIGAHRGASGRTRGSY